MNKYYIYILIAAFIWGTSFPAITIGLRYTNPEMLLFLRYSLATIISFILFPNTIIKLKDKNLIIIGLFNGLAYLLQFIGQEFVPAGQSSILVNFYSVLVPIIAIFILHEKPSKTIILALIIGFTGVILLTGSPGIVTVSYRDYLFGVVTIFFSGVSWAFYVVYTKKFQLQRNVTNNALPKYTYQELFTASMFYTALIAFISLFFIKNPLANIRLEGLLVSVYLAVFASVIAFLIYLIGLDKLTATRVSILLLSEVLIAYIISILFLKENISLLQVLGSIFIFISIILVITKVQKEKIIN